MLKTYTIPLACPACGQPMTVEVQLTGLFADAPKTPPRKRVACPRDRCSGLIEANLHGDIVAVWAGHQPRRTES